MDDTERHERKGLTRAQAASLLDVSEGTLKRWESGASIPSAKACDMAELYGCTVDYLLGRSDERL